MDLNASKMNDQDNLNNITIPQPEDISKKEKEDAYGSYLMMLATLAMGLPLPLLNLIASIIYFVINSKKSRFVSFHAYQSLITQIPVSLLNVFIISWTIYLALSRSDFGIVFFIVLSIVVLINLIYFILSLIAVSKAYHGNFFYFPIAGSISFNRYYGSHAIRFTTTPLRNIPPN
jgi:uncharacterized membrane protein